MSRFIASLVFLFITISSLGQNISRHKADSIFRSLSRADEDTAHVNSLLRLAQFEIFKPGELKNDLDSAAAFIKQARDINEKIKSVQIAGYITLAESQLYKERGQREEARVLAKKAVQMLSKETDKFLLGQAYLELSYYYDYSAPDQLPQRIRLVEHAVNNFEKSGHIEQTAYSLKMLGEFYGDAATAGKADSFYYMVAMALEKLKLSLALYKSIHYVELQGVYVLLGETYYEQADYKQALNYELMALKTAEYVRDTTMQQCQINNQIGVTLIRLGEYQKSIDYFKNAIQTASRYKDYESIYILTSNIVDAYIKSEKPLDAKAFLEKISKNYPQPKNDIELNYRIAGCYVTIYMMLKHYHKAEPYCNQLLSIINSGKIAKFHLSNIYVILIKYYFSSRQYSLALTYLIKNNSLTLEIGDPVRIGINNNLWFGLDTAQHRYQSAIAHLLIYHRINDSMFTVTKTRQAQQLQVQFETEKKENQIRLLRQKAKLDLAELDRANLVKNITICVIILTVIIAGLFYRQYRQKQKTNLVITQKNAMLEHLLTEKEWLLKEVHHRVKNNLHTVICLLESQAIYLENDALKAIENSQHRIYAMSLIHQKLYQSDDVKTIDMKVYLHEFVRYLADSFGSTDLIHFQLDIEPVTLGVSQAIPLGLIINEAVTNAIKYAFPENQMGVISIQLSQTGEKIKLVVADNGIGIPQGISEIEVNSLGIDLMKGLSRDLKGEIHFEIKKGTKITVIFGLDSFDSDNHPITLTERNQYA